MSLVRLDVRTLCYGECRQRRKLLAHMVIVCRSSDPKPLKRCHSSRSQHAPKSVFNLGLHSSFWGASASMGCKISTKVLIYVVCAWHTSRSGWHRSRCHIRFGSHNLQWTTRVPISVMAAMAYTSREMLVQELSTSGEVTRRDKSPGENAIEMSRRSYCLPVHHANRGLNDQASPPA